jgi:hypothetical protein
MRNHRFAVLFVLAFLFLALAVAWASITGSVSGVVTDKSGAVVSDASVVATDTLTGVKTAVTTDTKGFYNLATLAVGTYDLEISKPGFKTYKKIGFVIDANAAIRTDVILSVGGIDETIVVSSEAARVETQSTQMGEVIEGDKMTSVPLNGRSYIDLLALQPGVSPYQNLDTTSGVGATTVSGDITNGTQSVNGGRLGSNGFMVNGANAEEGVHNGAAMIPNLDSISEFRIITNNFDAEYGNFSGGQINVVTKSGTNAFHGDVFEFLRNTDFDAANYYTGRGDFKQNIFGGTVGGPIKKDKIFFFGDYQGTKQILGQSQSFNVPSTADRSGNLSDQALSLTGSVVGTSAPPSPGSPGGWAYVLSQRLGYPVTNGEAYYTPGCTSNTQCVFPNAIIPQSAWDPVAVQTLQYIPQPTQGFSLNGGPAFETAAANGTLTDNKGGIRLDVNTHYGTLFGYYFLDQFTTLSPYTQGINIPGFSGANQGRSQMLNLGLTTTINSTTVNDVRFAWVRDVNHTGIPSGGSGVSLSSLGFNTPWNTTGGIGNINPALVGVPSFAFNNYEFGLPQDTLNQFNNTTQILDNFTKIVGTHTFQFGFNFHYNQINERNYDDPNGAFTFTGSETGVDFADFLIGAPTSFTQASQQLLDSRGKYFGVYGQDSWRATPNLTINYGLRYEIMTPWYDTQNKLETLISGEQSQVFPTAPLGLVVPGDPGVPRTLAPTRYSNFAPRIGLAYSPSVTDGILGKILGGPGKSSIRAGYGIFFSAIEDATGFVEVGDAPYGLYFADPVPTQLNSPYIVRQTGLDQGPKFPFTFPPPGSSPSNPDSTFNWGQAEPIDGADYLYPKDRVPYVEQFELSFQRQIGSSMVLTASYVGSVGRHLLTFEESNPGNQALCLFLDSQVNPQNVSPTSPSSCGPFGEDASAATPIQLAAGVTAPGFPGVTSFATTRLISGFGSPTTDNFGSNPFMETVASSSFNSLQVSVKYQQKYANFLLAYTYEKSLDNGSTSFDATSPYNAAQSRGLSVFDVPQDLTLSYTVQLPFNNLTGNSMKRLTSGWALSGITTFATGLPVQLSENDDNALTGAFSASIDVPSYTGNGSHLIVNRNPRSGQPYFNPNIQQLGTSNPAAYFAVEPLGQVGNAMRRYFFGPGLNNFDMALLKDTQLSESVQLQFRAEAFNILNHAQFTFLTPTGGMPGGLINNVFLNPTTGQPDGGFGFVNTANNPRILQLALKLIF